MEWDHGAPPGVVPDITIVDRCVALGAQVLSKVNDGGPFIVHPGHVQLGKCAEGGFSEGRFADVPVSARERQM